MAARAPRVLVAGGAGFIGAYVVHALLARGAEVAVLDAQRQHVPLPPAQLAAVRSWRARELLHGAALTIGSITDHALVTRLLGQFAPDIVIQLADYPLVRADQPALLRADIVDSTAALVAAIAASAHVERLVYVSSSMVYGAFGDTHVDETVPLNPANAYGAMKRDAEALVAAAAAASGRAAVIVRPSGVYGPGDSNRRVVATLVGAALAGAPATVTHPAPSIDFTYVGDLADGIARAALLPAAAGEVFNLTRGVAHTLDELVAVITAHVPGFAVTYSARDAARSPARGALDIGKARRLLGYDPQTSLAAGVARLIAHLQTPTLALGE